MNPTHSTYIQQKRIYCTDPGSSDCDRVTQSQVSTFQFILHLDNDMQTSVVPYMPENALLCDTLENLDDDNTTDVEEIFMQYGCYNVTPNSHIQAVQEYYMNGDWTYPVNVDFDDDVTIYSGRRSTGNQYEIHSTIMRNDTLQDTVQMLFQNSMQNYKEE